MVGVIVALIAGYKGGWVDAVLSTFTGILLVIPTFPLLIALSAYAQEVTLFQVGLMLSIFSLAVRGEDDQVPGAEPADPGRTSSWRR